MVMRRLHEDSQGLRSEHLDGLKIHLDDGWVLVLPDVAAPLFHVRVETQDPETAEHNSMPRSAVATGMVDFVLPLAEIAPAIITLITKGDEE